MTGENRVTSDRIIGSQVTMDPPGLSYKNMSSTPLNSEGVHKSPFPLDEPFFGGGPDHRAEGLGDRIIWYYMQAFAAAHAIQHDARMPLVIFPFRAT